MTTYFCAASGDNSDGLTWAKAKTTLQGALDLATVAGDVVVIQYDGVPTADKEVAADTTWTIPASIAIIASTNSGSATVTPTAMGTTGWIGNSTTSVTLTLRGSAGNLSIYVFGVTIRDGSNGSRTISVNNFATNYGDAMVLDQCYIWHNTGTSSLLAAGGGASAMPSYTKFRDCTIRFGAAGQAIGATQGYIELQNTTISSAGTAPTTLVLGSAGAGCTFFVEGCDLSLVTGTLLGNLTTSGNKRWTFKNCKLGAGVTVMASQTNMANLGGVQVDVICSDSGATSYRQERYNPLGSHVAETTVVRSGGATDGTTPISWLVVTTANASWPMPFECMPMAVWNDTINSNVTVTVYGIWGGGAVPKNDEIWIEVSYMGSGASPLATINSANTKTSFVASNADQSTDASSWGGSTTAFKMAVTLSSPQPAIKGPIYVTVKVAKASSTFYVDPMLVLS